MTKEEMIAKKEQLEREIGRITAEESIHKEWDDYVHKLYIIKNIFEENGFREDQAMAILLKIIGGIVHG